MTALAQPQTLQAQTAPASAANDGPPVHLTGIQRAAIILVSLGQEHAETLAKLLGIEAMRRIHHALTEMPQVPEREVFAALADFITQLERMQDGLRGGQRQAAQLLGDVLGEALMSEIMKPIHDSGPITEVWTAFGELDPETIAEFVGRQHGAVAAILLYKLPSSLVPEVLGLMPSDVAVEAIGLMSRAENPSEAALDVAERLVERELLASATDPSSDPKIIMIGETLGTLPRDLRDAALARLDKEDEVRAAAIRSTLLRIEDLPKRLPTKSIQVVFKEVDKTILMEGLAAAGSMAPEVKDFLLGNIAQRMADTYREEISEMKEMDASEQDRAIGALVRELLGLARRELITLLPPPQADED